VLIYEFPDFTRLIISHGSPMLALDPEQVGPASSSAIIYQNLKQLLMSAHWESQG
jgi:4,5-DOPA dioxygenase extradiol